MSAPYVDPNDPRFQPGAGAPPLAVPPPPAAAAPVSNRPLLDTSTTSTTTEKLSKPQLEDFAALDKLGHQQQAAQGKLAADQVKNAEVEQQSAQEQAAAAQAQQEARAAAIEEAQRRRQEAEVIYQQKLDAFNKQDFHSFFSNRGAASEVLADVGVALGAFGAGFKGGRNEALQLLNARVAQDFDVQKAQIEKAKDSVVMAKTGIQDADEARKVALEDLDIKQAAAMTAIKTRLEAGKAAQLGSTAAAQGDKDVAQIGLDIQARKEKTTAGMATRTIGSSTFLNPAAVELKANAHKEASAKNDETGLVNVGRDAQGNPIILGRAVAGRGGPLAIAQQDIQNTTAVNAMKALLADVKDTGEHPLTPAHIARRQGLEADAKKAMAVVSPLGKSNEALEVEGASAGIHGAFRNIFQGANPGLIEHQLKILEERQQAYRDQATVPLTPEEKAKFTARHPGDTSEPAQPVQHGAPLAPVQAPELTPDNKARLKALLAKYPNDPRAPEARKLLGM